jgi:two-component system cell cycle response regulator
MPKARILAVDDQRYFRELMEAMLAEQGYEVRTAPGGAEALHALEREDFDIVVTDVVMPEMDGTELVRQIKERLPNQDVVMVTGVVDVGTVVEAMKLGAADYIIKPFDRESLTASLDTILQRRRSRDEHERLVAENLEYMGVLSLYERALGLFSTLSLEPLAERLIEGLCLETLAQGAVLWAVEDLGDTSLRLAAARGLIRVDGEPEVLDLARLDDDFRPLLEEGRPLVLPRSRTQSGAAIDGDTHVLYLPLRHARRTIGIARLGDKLEGADFDERDIAAAETFVGVGAQACANALRFRSIERRTFLDPTTKAYTHAYFEDGVRNEIQKADRFGRQFSIIRLECAGLGELRRTVPAKQLAHWLETLVDEIGGALRATDVLASQSESRYSVLMPETGAVGAAYLKRRIRNTVEQSGVLEGLEAELPPALDLVAATYPTDGTQLESLERVLEVRLESGRESLLHELDIEGLPFAHALECLLEQAEPERTEVPAQIARFLLDEVLRRPRDRGLLFLSPGERLMPVVREGLEKLGVDEVRTEIVMVAERVENASSSSSVTWVSPRRVDSDRPFFLYYGDGPAYALVTANKLDDDGLPMFHTADRALVEELAIQLQRDLGIPLGT